jgi:uncharacterized membrane protein YkvI
MMLASWLWGQKRYPVPYGVGKILLLMVLAVLLTLLREWLNSTTGVAGILLSIILLLAYLVAGLFILKHEIKSLLKPASV